MADARQEHLETAGWVGAAIVAFFGACRAALHRRKKQPTLSEEVLERIQGNVIAALRKEMQASLANHESQMQHALSLIDHGVLEIKRLVLDVPDIKVRISQLESAMEVTRGDITEIRGELRRRRER